MSRPKKQSQCSRNDIKDKYQAILKDIKDKGYKVVHKKLSKEVAGYFNPDTYGIEIDKTIKNTLDGCYTLLHEWAHAMDFRQGKFKKFFDMREDAEYSDENLALIEEAELSAAKTAQRQLKCYGINYTPHELTEKGLKDCREFWRKEYFKKKS